MWMRTMHDLPAHQNYHRCVLAFLSDFGLATTALRPHGAPRVCLCGLVGGGGSGGGGAPGWVELWGILDGG